MVTKLTLLEKRFKNSPEYIKWRTKIYELDNWTCKIPSCGYKGKRIEAHHIYPFRDFPDLRLNINNGITLCFWCHRQVFGKEFLLAKGFLGLIENRVNSVELLLIKDNTEPSLDRNIEEGVTTRNRIFNIERFIKKKVYCSVCRKILYRHYYRIKRNKYHFCSYECYRKNQNKFYYGKKHGNYQKRPRMKCLYCGKFIKGTPTQRLRIKKYCNNTCQLKLRYKDSNVSTKSLPEREDIV